ncbi:MAG: HDOD domain-containing protein [Nitrospiraceae bacterium]|nr:MAG: HDOD domain-containing protein [Nitrospiraceae bacterium]
MNEALRLSAQSIKKLPTLPVIAQEILSSVNDDRASVAKIEKVVGTDPAIAARILSVANSAFFGSRVKSTSLGSAIMRIGFNSVKNIALGISLMTVLQDGNGKKASRYKRIFNHSVTTGFVARLLARRLKLEFAEDIMMQGMLHDLGYLVLNKYLAEPYADVLDYFDGHGDLLDAEGQVLGFTHAEMGEWIALQWNLPRTIADSTRCHHAPSQAKRNVKRTAVIHLADFVTTQKLLSPVEKDPSYPFDRGALDILGMSDDDFSDAEAELTGGAYSAELL